MKEIVRITGDPAQIALFLSAIVLSLVGTLLYRKYALKRGIRASVNFRSLHKEEVPRGGGIVFAAVFAIASVAACAAGALTTHLTLLLAVGGTAGALFGFIDDILEVRASIKILAHGCLAAWGVAVLSQTAQFATEVEFNSPTLVVVLASLFFVFVWFINLYNFIDGIDGMAITGCLYICIASILILAVTGGDSKTVFALMLLGACSVGFLIFNLPPARIFMGDAGSIFLGYTIAGLFVFTVISRQMTVWTWLAILSYFIGDTSVTGAYRLMRVRKWYGAHRSHAYQNLARIYKSHALVTYGVNLYNYLWALPLALWSALVPENAPIAAMLALAPTVAWAFRFGPRLSSS